MASLRPLPLRRIRPFPWLAPTMLTVTLALLPSLAAAQALEPQVAPLQGAPALEAALLAQSNTARLANGVATLASDAGLALAARHHAREMAELGYFSHGSPDAENATLQQRLARAGAPEVTVAENLARLRGQPDLAAAAVAGWLESPGHRRNLLDARFDRVGFGTAVDAAGETVIVQVLAYAPRTLLRATAETGWEQRYEIEVRLRADPAVRTVLLALGDGGGRSHELAPTGGVMTLATRDPGPLQLRVGVPLPSGSFVLDAAAWLEPERGVWRPDPTLPGGQVEIADVQIRTLGGPSVRVRLEYPAATPELALFVNEEHRPDARVAPGVFEVVLPADRQSTLFVGEVGGERVVVFHGFRLVPSGGGGRLLAGTDAP